MKNEQLDTKQWWETEIGYQVYPRSFQDSNNDGIGDLRGIIDRLDYLQDLGITLLWISPCYTSPMKDMGYDIADYYNIDPQFGTMADFEELLNEAKKRGIKVIMDLIVNHCSDQNEWFQEALNDPGSKYRDYFIFKKSKNGPPNNWRSIFNGSVWEPVPGDPDTYYFHTFLPEQPELNWENPALREEMYTMINWWLDKGVAGFRVDAITHLKKDLDWESIEADGPDGLASVVKKGQNRPGIDKFLTELKEKTFDVHGAVTVGEAYGVPNDELDLFIGPHGYFSMIFDFSYLNIEMVNHDEWYRGFSDWTVTDLKRLMFGAQETAAEIPGWLATTLENHDQPRVLSKLIVDKKNQTPTAAKALGVMYFFLPGVPFIYQGQELGMKNFERTNIDEFNDVSSLGNYQGGLDAGMSEEDSLTIVNAKSRDNARVPMQWDDTKYAGFSDVEPWLPMGTDRQGISVAEETEDPSSVLNFYKEMIAVRKKYQDFFAAASIVEVDIDDNVVAYERILQNEKVTVLVNLSSGPVRVENIAFEDVLLNNLPKHTPEKANCVIKPFQSLVLRSQGK